MEQQLRLTDMSAALPAKATGEDAGLKNPALHSNLSERAEHRRQDAREKEAHRHPSALLGTRDCLCHENARLLQ